MNGLALPLARPLARARPAGGSMGTAGLSFGLLAPLLASNGGYFPTAWGWSALALSWIAALTLLLRGEIPLGRLELAVLGALGGLTAWTFLSFLWASSATEPVLEGERTLVYLAGALAFLLLARRASIHALLAGAWAAIVAACGYGLLTRLLPDRIGVFDPIAGYRLSEPVGYWNALGLAAAMGVLLALGLTARGRAQALRAAAAASLPVLLTALYFTFSRGAWIALGAGLLAALALDRHRLQLVAVWVVSLGPAVVGVWLASRSDALTRQNASIVASAGDGHRLALVLAGLAAASAAASLGILRLEGRVAPRPPGRAAARAALVLAAVATLAVLTVQFGSPPALAKRGWRAFSAPPVEAGPDLNRRLLSFSGSGRVIQWRVAWRQYEESPVLGFGAGSYERYWLEHRPLAGKVRDVHSLYLEQLAELGPVGLALLVAAFGTPLIAMRRARAHPLAATAAGAYVAYLLHAGVDWDWEMPALTLTALLCAAVLLGAARDGAARPLRRGARLAGLAAALAIGAAALAGLAGNAALSGSADAAAAGDWANARTDARRAIRWAPWSSEPRRVLGEAELGAGDPAAAARAFREAIAKDSRDWSLWFDLARAADGSERLTALGRASQLNPLSPEVAQFRAELKFEGTIDLLPERKQ